MTDKEQRDLAQRERRENRKNTPNSLERYNAAVERHRRQFPGRAIGMDAAGNLKY